MNCYGSTSSRQVTSKHGHSWFISNMVRNFLLKYFTILSLVHGKGLHIYLWQCLFAMNYYADTSSHQVTSNHGHSWFISNMVTREEHSDKVLYHFASKDVIYIDGSILLAMNCYGGALNRQATSTHGHSWFILNMVRNFWMKFSTILSLLGGKGLHIYYCMCVCVHICKCV